MTLSQRFSNECRLYVIVDPAACRGRDPVEIAEQAIEGGADAIQLRDKQPAGSGLAEIAATLRDLTRRAGKLFIINDYLDLCVWVGADGVHLGQKDASIARARRILSPGILVGRSTHSLEQALAAQNEGTDYIGVGPVFQTPTKPNAPAVGLSLVEQVQKNTSIPFVAIGGIDEGNIEAVRSAGAKAVAVVRAVVGAADVRQAAKILKDRMDRVDVQR